MGKANPPGSGWSTERSAKCVELWKAGASYTDIAKALGNGATRSAVCGHVTRLGLTRKGAYTRPRRLVSNPLGAEGVARMKVRAERLAKEPFDPTLSGAGLSSPGAKPWTERRFGECAYPVGGTGADTVSCCNLAVASPRGPHYCAGHAGLMTMVATRGWKTSEIARMMRRVG